MEHRDEIDKWLYEEMQLIPGSCSSISTLQYNTARAVAEKLWQSWEDIQLICEIDEDMRCHSDWPLRGQEVYYEEVLRRFRETKNK